MISFSAFSDELEKIAAAKWREVARAGGEGLKRLEEAGLRTKQPLRSTRGAVRMKMPQAHPIKDRPGVMSFLSGRRPPGSEAEHMVGELRRTAKEAPAQTHATW